MLIEYNKYFPATLSLETTKIKLRLLDTADFIELKKITSPPAIWAYFVKDLSVEENLQQWIADALLEKNEQKRMPFAILDKQSNTICGSTSFGNISFYDKTIEIGWTWLGTQFMGTGINHHAKYILLNYAFNILKMERVEIKTDNLNIRAKKALIHIGATEEGILRSHMLMHGDRRRDTVYYSILKNEWEDVQMLYFGDMG